MGIPHHSKKRDANEKQLVEDLRALGMRVKREVWRLHNPVDLLIGWRGRTLLVEVKDTHGRLTSLQEDFIRDWQGGAVIVAQNVDDILRWFDENTT